ncbi:L-aspartate oxidase [Cyanobacterium stanieri LEGE 03274]|uniref:L-aspartate oxidase n=1 Tax=Cyanobacterium stanieri LEGE 03274 TaxID=1828756 RepID=A0ABR9V266_9CHRO|nr:L-aspartate oxidase [Cyanobacterium stanieri]MBE9221972.1 L-aspartate oxidase [Cyanobacterium stanieri LEGE 03274]
MNSIPRFPDHFDVIIVGSGAAGLYAALKLPTTLRIGLITKDKLKKGASDWAQGGIAAAIAPNDSPVLHLEDTLKAGAGLCDRTAVKYLVENAVTSIRSLLEMGVEFDRHNDQLAMTLEAAHSFPRVLHAADTTGRAIVSILRQRAMESENISVYEQAYALDLWLDEEKEKCQGLCLLHKNKISWLGAKAVILATGGGGQVFAQTTNPKVSTGDGVALAWRSGALLRNLEFVQFHPTALKKENAPRFLISEAVRGEGAHLIDREGKRFTFDYHPKGELAPRDVVSRAIYNHLHKISPNPALDNVFLDLRPIPRPRLEYRFPNIIKRCQDWGIDVFSEPIPVSPAAHYWMGGIAVDLHNKTSIEGLYAIGETANTGVHGANRLASNSLLECLVFGETLKDLDVGATVYPSLDGHIHPLQGDGWQDEMTVINKIRKELPLLVWEVAGICRRHDMLQGAIALIQQWQNEIDGLKIGQFLKNLKPKNSYNLESPIVEQQLKLSAETLNLLEIGYLIVQSALFRTESRGGHYRLDYPETQEKWECHTLIKHHNWWSENVIF